MRISYFERPVTNTQSQKTLDWNDLCDLILKDPILLPDNNPETKAKLGDYITRGFCPKGRTDDLLKECYLLILDVDKPIDEETPLPTPEEINNALVRTDVAFAVHSTATPGRCRIFFACDEYDKNDVDQKTWEAYCFCKEKGLYFAFAGESKKKSQPFFLPQTVNPLQHQAFVHKSGYLFDSSFLQEPAPIFQKVQDQPPPKEKTSSNGARDQRWFIGQLKSGTLHQAAVSYSGFLKETTSWTAEQVMDHLTTLVELHANDKLRDRWNKWERKGLEKWVADQGFISGKVLSDEGKNIIENLKKTETDKIKNLIDKCCSLKELKSKKFAPIQWVVNGMIPAGLVIVGGRPKVGKSFFCLDLVDSVANGTDCFGSLKTRQGTAIYISLEDGQRRVNKRLNDLALNPSENSFMLDECLPINSGLKRLISGLKEAHKDLSLVVIDTMTHVILPPGRGVDNYNYYSMTLTALQHLAAELDITIVLMHHLKKGMEGNVFDKFLGSVGFQGAADTMIVIERKVNETNGFFTVSSRDMGDNTFSMQFNEMKWEYIGETAIACGNANYILIAEEIKRSPEGYLKQKEIIEKTSLPEGTVKTAIKKMLEMDLICRVDRGLYGLNK